MNWEWISQKSAGLIAIAAGLALIAVGFFNRQYRYVFLCVAVVVLVYGYKQLKKRCTPFERREREIRRRTL